MKKRHKKTKTKQKQINAKQNKKIKKINNNRKNISLTS